MGLLNNISKILEQGVVRTEWIRLDHGALTKLLGHQLPTGTASAIRFKGVFHETDFLACIDSFAVVRLRELGLASRCDPEPLDPNLSG